MNWNLDWLDFHPPIEWDNLEQAGTLARSVLFRIAEEPGCLEQLLSRMIRTPRLLQMAEHHDRIDQIILHDDLSRGIRIRLHVYPDDHFDGPHNHRWPFTAVVLAGSYRHKIFGVGLESIDNEALLDLKPVMVRDEVRGSSYSLDPLVVHSVVAAPGTVSLMLRGPAVTEKLLMTDLQSGRGRWKFGRTDESAADLKAREFPPGHLRKNIEYLSRLDLIRDVGELTHGL